MSAWVIYHSDSGPGYEWVDMVAVFSVRDAAEHYLARVRGVDPNDEPEVDLHSWHMVELPLNPLVMPERVQYRWKVPA